MNKTADTETLVGFGLGSLAAILVSAALVPLRDEMINANVALVLVIVVVGATVVGGRWAGVGTAAVAALSFDFFHTAPYNTLRIDSADDLETTLLLALVGVIVGEVVARARVTRSEVVVRHADIDALYRVAEAVSQGAPADEVIALVETEVQAVLHLVECRYEATPSGPPLPSMTRTGSIDTVERRYARGGFELPRDGCQLSVMGRGQSVGRLVLVPTEGVGVSSEQRVVAVALSDQLGALIAT